MVAVSSGTLDGLVGLTGSALEIYSASLVSYMSTGTNSYAGSFSVTGSGASEAVASVTVTSSNGPEFGFSQSITETFKVLSVNDATNSLTLEGYDYGVPVGEVSLSVIGFNAGALFLSTQNSNALAIGLLGQDEGADSPFAGIFSPGSLANGTTLTFTATGVYTGGGSTAATNTVSITNPSTMPTAIVGDVNVEDFSPAGSNQSFFIATGFQTASITGSNTDTYYDFNGGVTFDLSGGNSTVVFAASSADTANVMSGNNAIVAFKGGEVINAAGATGNNLYYGAVPASIVGGNGHDVAIMGEGGTFITGTGGTLIFLGSGSATITSNGPDTIAGGTGAATVNVLGASGDLAFGGTGSMVFNGGSGASTAIGIAASITVTGGTGGGLFYGGSSGNNVIASGSGQATLIGGGSGDVLTATGTANDVLEATFGTETLNAAGSSGTDAFFGGVGSDCIIGGTGSNAFSAGPGNMTLVGGGTADLYVFVDGATSKTVIQGFNPSHDFIDLAGFATGAAQTALSTLSTTAAGAVMTLSDGTQITFTGIATSQISSGLFV